QEPDVDFGDVVKRLAHTVAGQREVVLEGGQIRDRRGVGIQKGDSCSVRLFDGWVDERFGDAQASRRKPLFDRILEKRVDRVRVLRNAERERVAAQLRPRLIERETGQRQ